MTPGWDHPEPFFIRVRVTPDDIDSYGHVNNAVYIRWLEACAWAHSSAVGFPESRCLELARGMAVRTIHADYLAACFEGDDIEVGNWLVENDGRLRARRRFQVINRTREQVAMRAEVDYFCMNLDTGRPVRMPPEFVSGYAVRIVDDDKDD